VRRALDEAAGEFFQPVIESCPFRLVQIGEPLLEEFAADRRMG